MLIPSTNKEFKQYLELWLASVKEDNGEDTQLDDLDRLWLLLDSTQRDSINNLAKQLTTGIINLEQFEECLTRLIKN